MKKFGILMIVFFVFSLLSAPMAFGADKKELSFSLIIPPKHLRYTNVLEPWINKIEKESGKKVDLTVYFGASLAPPPQTFESVVSGMADIAEGIVYATPGQFPLTEMIMLPELGLDTSLEASTALWDAYKEIPELRKEWDNVKMLWLHTTPPIRLITRKKPVRNLEDLKGMKIRVSGAVAAKMGKALGFTPVSMGMGELYQALEKGVIDGVALPNEILVSRRLGEVTDYVTTVDLGHDAFFIVMNQSVWNGLSQDVKDVFNKFSGEWAVEFTGKGWDKFDAESVETNKEKFDIEYIDLPPEEMNRWKKRLAPVKEAYAKELDAKGLPGTELLEFLRSKAK